MCKNHILFLPVNILAVWCSGFVGRMTHYHVSDLLGPNEQFLVCFFPIMEIKAFKDLNSLKETTKSSRKRMSLHSQLIH